jgi:hypothetical protein
MPTRTAWVVVPFLALACSGGASDHVSPIDSGSEGGSALAEDGSFEGGTNGDRATQSGTIVAYQTMTGVPGVSVALGAATGVTDASGRYSVAVAKNTNYELVLTAPGYFKTISQEWQIAADVDRGRTNFLTEDQWATAVSVVSAIGGVSRDSTLGMAVLLLTTLTPCTTTGGATVSISPADPTTRYVYTDDTGLPSVNPSTSAQPLAVYAIMYNIPVGPVAVTVSSPSCTQAAWPVSADASGFGGGSGPYTDMGAARVEAGNAVSYLHVYLQ